MSSHIPGSYSDIEGRVIPEYPEEGTQESAVITATVQEKNKNFEWNVGRLYSHQEGHSTVRTWAVRILSTALVLPVVLTLLLDLGRRVAFSCGLVNGKSWSLVEELSNGFQKISNKAKSVYESYRSPQPKTIEQLNKHLEKEIQKHAQKLVDAYRALNGGYFHTNTSFSSPNALNAEKQIVKEKAELIRFLNIFVAGNTSSANDLKSYLDLAKGFIVQQIAEAAKDDVYIENKVVRTGPRPLLKDIVCKEFLEVVEKVNQPVTAAQYVELAKREEDVIVSLKEGVDHHRLLTQEQAKEVVAQYIPEVFEENLQKGLEKATQTADGLISSAKNQGIIGSKEEKDILATPANVNTLAKAAALDVVQHMDENATDLIVKQQLVESSESLIQTGRLTPENQSQFLNEAFAQIDDVKRAVEQELIAKKAAEEAEELEAQRKLDAEEAQRVEEVQKAQDQASLLNQFQSYLLMLSSRQSILSGLHDHRDQLKILEKNLADQITTLRKEQVKINGNSISIVTAVGAYAKMLVKISNQAITDEQKVQKLKELEEQGFTQQTIRKINEFNGLTQKLTQVTEAMAPLAKSIKEKNSELEYLVAVYKEFKKNQFKRLDRSNQALIDDKSIFATQSDLRARYRILPSGLSLFERMKRGENIPVINTNAEENLIEVERLLQEFALENKAYLQEQEGEIAPISATQQYIEGVKKGFQTAYYGLSWPIRAPLNAIASRWNKAAVQQEEPAMMAQEA